MIDYDPKDFETFNTEEDIETVDEMEAIGFVYEPDSSGKELYFQLPLTQEEVQDFSRIENRLVRVLNPYRAELVQIKGKANASSTCPEHIISALDEEFSDLFGERNVSLSIWNVSVLIPLDDNEIIEIKKRIAS